jgi:hypothetical protein
MGPTEADTCRKFVQPKLQAAGWDNEPHSIVEQRTFTDGRIFVVGSKTGRRKQKRADYLDALQAKVDELKRLQAGTQAELGALMPSILDRAFKGEL